jgi:hypothetical protein
MTSEPAHRMPPQRGPVQAVARLLFLQLLAVIGIAAAITAVAAVVGPDNNDDVRAAAPSHSPSGTPSPTGSPATTTAAPMAAGDSATPPVSTSPATPSGTSGAVVKVDVLNQSAPNGTARQVADRLRAAGWKIGRVDDFQGNVRTTTVYWLEPDQRRQARQISRFLGGVRVQQGFDTLVDGRVSVILVESS